MRVLDFLEALDIDPDEENQSKCGCHQIKMMFEGEGCQALQTLIDNKTITPEAQRTPVQALRAIQSVIKEDVHFGTTMTKFFQTYNNSQMKVYMPSQIESVPSLARGNSPIKKSEKS